MGLFAVAIWLGMGLELADSARVIAGLALVVAVSGVSLVWLAQEKQTLLAALRLR